jgi:lantibiotic modifying enzyme
MFPIRETLGAALLALLVGCAGSPPTPTLQAAVEAGHFVRGVGVEMKAGRTWPANPEEATTRPPNLYSGSAGVVLFFLELHHATGDPVWLEEARAGADHLADTLETPSEAGLFTGTAGIGFVLAELYRTCGDPCYRAGAIRALELLEDKARKMGAGVEWGATTDVIGGTAGIGLFLLYAAETLDRPSARDLAVAAGRHLIELGEPAEGGSRWRMDPEYPRVMPNFSHGTAGVAHFLAELFATTGEREFLDAALAGAEHLLALTNQDGLIHHHTPGGEDLFYLGWCHGPAGTAYLYLRLAELTGDERWKEAAVRAAGGVLASGIPESRPGGFWNNVGQCCGSAGIAEFFLDLHLETGRNEYLAFAEELTDDLLSRSILEDGRRWWIQAEHRVRPELLAAQTGYMQGAAGVGLWLLRLDAYRRGLRCATRSPLRLPGE